MKLFPQLFNKCPTRLGMGLSLFLAFLSWILVHANFPLILLAMVENPNVSDELLPDFGPRYPWNAADQSLLLIAYYIGGIILAIPTGICIDKYDISKSFICFAFLTSSLMAALSTLAASWSMAALFAARFVIGIFFSGNVSCIMKILAKWSPPKERGRFMVATLGGDIGFLVTLSLSGWLIESFGWQWAFYASAGLGFTFAVYWYFIVAESPAKHSRISAAERQYIEESMIGIKEGKKEWPPLRKMFTSMPFLSLLACFFGHQWGTIFLLNSVPMFINDVLHYNLAITGVLVGIPLVCRCIFGILFGMLSDYFKRTQYLSLQSVRRWFTLFSHIFPGLLFVVVPFVSNYADVCIGIIILAFLFNGAIIITAFENVYEIAPNFLGTMSAVSNFLLITPGIFVPMITGFFTSQDKTIDEWQWVFYIGAAMYIGSGLVFMMFGSVKVQKWNEPKQKPEKVKEKYISYIAN